MVEWGRDAATGENIVVLKPNCSLSRPQAVALLAACALLMGGIGLVFAALGAWLVLPFSGLEWLLLAYCLRWSRIQSAQREVITISDAVVSVEQSLIAQTIKFQRAWVTVQWVESTIPRHPSRLCLRLHGKEVEIGRFLVESERLALAKELRRLLGSR